MDLYLLWNCDIKCYFISFYYIYDCVFIFKSILEGCYAVPSNKYGMELKSAGDGLWRLIWDLRFNKY